MAETKKKSQYNFGGHNFDTALYLLNLRDNAESFLNSKTDWTSEQKEEWKHSYTNFTNALLDLINNNTDRFSTDEFGTITDRNGEFSNTDSDNFYYNNKGLQINLEDYDKLKARKQGKYLTFEANRQFASYANLIGKGLRDALEAKKATSDSTDGFDYAKNGFASFWNLKYNPSGELVDRKLYWALDKDGQYTNRIAQTLTDLDEYLKRDDLPDDVRANIEAYKAKLQEYSTDNKDFDVEGWKNGVLLAASRAGLGTWNNGFFNMGSQDSATPESNLLKPFDINNDLDVINRYNLADLIAAHPELREHIIDLARRQYNLESLNITNEYNNAIKLELDTKNNKIWQLWLANEGKGYGDVTKRLNIKWYGNNTFSGNTDTIYLSEAGRQALTKLLNALAKTHWDSDAEGLFTPMKTVLPNGVTLNNVGEHLAFYLPMLRKMGAKFDDNFEEVTDNAGHKLWKVKNSKNKAGLYLYIWNKSDGKLGAYRDVPFNVKKAEVTKAFYGVKIQSREQRNAEKDASRKKVINDPTTPEDKKRLLAGQRKPGDTGFTATDIARITSAGLDVASAISAYVPVYGTAISAGTGLASTFTNLGADANDDSLSKWDVAKNFGTNLAMDVVGLIPGFGTAGKAGKVAKTLVKYVPRIVTALSAANALSPESRASWAKLASNESLTVKDWQNIAAGCSALAGVSRGAVGHFKANAMAKGTKTKDFNITAADGKQYKVTAELLETLKKLKSLEDINKEFKKIHPDAELNSFFRNGKWQLLRHLHFNNPLVKSTYDFSKLNNKGTFSDANIWRVARLNNLRGINIDIKNPYKNSLLKPTSLTVNKPTKKKYDGLRTSVRTKLQIVNSPLNNSPERYNYIRRSVLSNTGDNVKTWRDIFTLNHMYFKEGGSILKLANGDSINGNPAKLNSVGYSNDYNWNTDVFSKNLDHILGSLKLYKDGYANWLNSMLDLHYNDYSNASKLDYLNTNAYNNSTVGQYLDKYKAGYLDEWNVSPEGNDPDGLGYNTLGIKSALDAGKFGIVSGNANSGDWLGNGNMYKTDNSFGGITDARRLLGRLGDFNDNLLREYQLKFKDLGYDFYLDPKTNYYKLKPYIDPSKTTVADDKNKNPEQSNNFSVKDLLGKLDVTDKWGIPRAMYADITNRKVTDLLKKQPLLLDPQEDHRYIQSDLDAEMNGQAAAALLSRLASLPMTSDGNLQTAALLDAVAKGNEAITLGRQLSNLRLREMAEKAWELEVVNHTNRHNTAMQNRLSIYNTKNENNSLEAAYLNLKFTVWDALAQEKEFKEKSDYELARASADWFALQDISNAIKYGLSNYATKYGLTKEDVSLWNKVYVDGSTKLDDILEDPNKLKLWNKVLSATRQILQDLLGEYYGIPKSKYWTIRLGGYSPTITTLTKATSNKKGGHLNLRKVREAAKGEKLAAALLKAQTADADRFYKTTKDHIDRMYDAINRLTNYSSTKKKRKKKS